MDGDERCFGAKLCKISRACHPLYRAYAAMMTKNRRIGTESSETRMRIVLAAEDVLREEGYAAASTRRIATHAGLKPSLVHYYFPTTDDLFLAVFDRGAAHSDAMIDAALSDPDPLKSLWQFFADNSRNMLTIEFIALAIRRPALRAQVAEHSVEMRRRQAEKIAPLLGPDGPSASALAMIMAGAGRAMMMEAALGVSAGHDEARQWIDRWLDMLRQKP